MSSPESPHFEAHYREMKLTRRRYRAVLAAFLAIVVSVFAFAALRMQANPVTRLSGRVYNSVTGAGYSNVTVNLCNKTAAVTNANGVWTATAPAGDKYCVRYIDGAGGVLGGPVAAVNNPEIGAKASYENQIAGVDCYRMVLRCGYDFARWDRVDDSSLDLAFIGAPVVPHAAPSPHLVVPTQKRAVARVAVAGGIGGAVLGSEVAAAAGAPSVPGSFQATVADGNSQVSLSWDAATGPQGVKTYVMERSLDQINWDRLADDITVTKYTDTSSVFGIHYYYRLSALDPVGNASDYAKADVDTGKFHSNVGKAIGTTTYTSTDSVATANVQDDSIDAAANCSVDNEKINSTDSKLQYKGKKPIAGLYTLNCRTLAGDLITDIKKPISWAYALKAKMNGTVDPQAFTVDAATGHPVPTTSVFDQKTQILRFESVGIAQTLVMSAPASGLSLNIIVTLFIVLALVIGVLFVILRKSQRHKYDDYLRSRYYNI